MAKIIRLTFQGTPIDWEGDGVYSLGWFNSEKTWFQVKSFEAVRQILRHRGQVSWIQKEDLMETE